MALVPGDILRAWVLPLVHLYLSGMRFTGNPSILLFLGQQSDGAEPLVPSEWLRRLAGDKHPWVRFWGHELHI